MSFVKAGITLALLAIGGYVSWKVSMKRVRLSKAFNPWTQKYSSAMVYNESLYDCETCSWNLYKDNDLSEKSNIIKLFDDENITQEDPLIQCLPESFGYTLEEAWELFPDKHFPNCSELVDKDEDILQLDTKSNSLTMTCAKFKESGKFVLGEDYTSEVLGLREFTKPFSNYLFQVKTKTQEYAFGTCTEDKKKFLESAVYRHRPKEEVLNRQPHKDPIVIVMLTLDSVSRRAFFRKMPETVNYINNDLNKNFQVFDMKIHNVMGEFSANNIMPQLIGDNPYKMFWDIPEEDFHYKKSIWKECHERKYATLFIEEGCTNDLARYFGKNITIDHIGTSFWCAARRFNEFENNSVKQRCIGQHNSHVYVYNYIKEFSYNYKHLSQWAFSHVNTAHESSGLLISTMDSDTKDFLKSYLDQQSSIKTILIITGDHGMRYGDWFKKIDGSHEHRLPLGLIIASKSLLETIPNSIDVLKHNSQRLTSKLDLYTTQLHLIHNQENLITRDSQMYLDIKEKTSTRYKPVSLLLEKISNNRTCFDVGIPAFWCSCLTFVEVNEKYENFIYDIAETLIMSLNEEAYKPRMSPFAKVCQKMSLKDVVKLWVLSTDEEYYKLHFTVNESETVLFESVVLMTWRKYRARNVNDAYPQIPYYEHGKKIFNVMYMRRVDSYAGPCEFLAKDNNIRPEICICKPELLESPKEFIELR